jgi:hypothetical protein
VTLHLLAAGFAALMLVRHGRAALAFLAPRSAGPERWKSLPGFVTSAVALALLFASLRLYLAARR